MVSDRCSECISGEQAAAALPAVIRHPDLILFKTSQRIAAEVLYDVLYHVYACTPRSVSSGIMFVCPSVCPSGTLLTRSLGKYQMHFHQSCSIDVF